MRFSSKIVMFDATDHWKSYFIDAHSLATATEVTHSNYGNAQTQHSFRVLLAGVCEAVTYEIHTSVVCVITSICIFRFPDILISS